LVYATFVRPPGVPTSTPDEELRAAEHCTAGGLLLEEGKYAQAIQELTAAIELDPSLAAAYDKRGMAYYQLGDLKHCAEDYKRASELMRYASAYVQTSACELGLAHFDEASAAASEAISIDILEWIAYANRGVARLETGDYEGALRDLTDSLRIYPDAKERARTYGTRAEAHVRLGNNEDALSDVEVALRADPERIEALYARALVRESEGQSSQALSDVEQALRIFDACGEECSEFPLGQHQLGKLEDLRARLLSEEGA
jgi:tetratricopeptide (TPR) repeat protein